jgi:hypothetical protein
MPLDDDSKKLLAINTHKGLYEYNRLTFGMASAPSIWQRAMDQILQGLSGVQCVLDDMIITGKSDDEHLQNLENVLQRLQDNGLRANIKHLISNTNVLSTIVGISGHVIFIVT